MKTRKEYVPPRLIVVKLNPTQAVLSQCSVGATTLFKTVTTGECSSTPNCRQGTVGHGNSLATS